mmetsp:Transcript_7389/g.11630  ORF Transcript_7389/g.11630 Transcript_7389/m.11630 type:complete len:106 (-) Transcript_7389:607-924(-)
MAYGLGTSGCVMRSLMVVAKPRTTPEIVKKFENSKISGSESVTMATTTAKLAAIDTQGARVLGCFHPKTGGTILSSAIPCRKKAFVQSSAMKCVIRDMAAATTST